MRVERAFAFTDLSGFTGFTHRNGDEAAREVLTQFRGLVRDVVDDHGIRVSKWLGDGAMIVSVDLSALVAALIQMHDRMAVSKRTLPIRSGVTVGNVMVFEGNDYIGSTVNLASRLCDAAADNEILAHAIVAGRLGSALTTVPLGSRSLPGFGSAIEVVKILTAADDGSAHLAGASVTAR